MKKYVLSVALVAGLFAGATQAQDGVNIARNSSASYIYLDRIGDPMVWERDADCSRFSDGKRDDKNSVPSVWGPNMTKAMRLRYDFKQEVHPTSVRIVWMFSGNPGHVMDRVRVLSGNDPASMGEVGVLEVKPSGKRSTIIDVPLTGAAGRYLEISMEQDKNPSSKMFSISEIEVYAPKSERD
ncbi:hypothetical protein [Tichowtungia aerotolerans]|uniref:Uncharacterized protein n=1 Tax=Tichowtungia aerotolerans TaxID=2697043 RepID=A0A6P1M5Z8_9BACT|nr:hypothetical protein [Tichowtungia aerotolerans]QHI68034.1 hypothetical protein GT409_00730 [Tichowtungia aerotolerans]